MRLLVTRPAQDADSLAERLRAGGHEAVIDPLLTVSPIAFALPEAHIAAIVVTSRFGARALAAHAQVGRVADKPIYCVGAATAEAARAGGLGHVIDGGGDAAALAVAVGTSLDRNAGIVLHVRGRHTRGGLAERLALRGFKISEAIAYEARAAERLAPETRHALEAGDIDGVLLFSPRTAETLVTLLTGEDLLATIVGRTAFCLSSNVARVVGGLGMSVRVPAEPTLEALIELVGTTAPSA